MQKETELSTYVQELANVLEGYLASDAPYGEIQKERQRRLVKQARQAIGVTTEEEKVREIVSRLYGSVE